ncbi:MAG: hypothetical protein OS112_00415 [Methanoregula sp.]|nr:MAG: hypothetical protein OS112_00415 [Methanoregula sp.]
MGDGTEQSLIPAIRGFAMDHERKMPVDGWSNMFPPEDGRYGL